MDKIDGPALARAASGVVYGYSAKPVAATKYVVEHGPPGIDRWPSPGADFALMQRVKDMFDPTGLLNRGALHGRI
jgi:FAD/FMN-containing dehydrogenase